MIASSQVKHPWAVSFGAQPLTSGTPIHCPCNILPRGFVRRHQVSAVALDLLCVHGASVHHVHRHHGAGHIVSFQGPWILMDKCYPGHNLVSCRACVPKRGCKSDSWQILGLLGVEWGAATYQMHSSDGGLQIFVLSLGREKRWWALREIGAGNRLLSMSEQLLTWSLICKESWERGSSGACDGPDELSWWEIHRVTDRCQSNSSP